MKTLITYLFLLFSIALFGCSSCKDTNISKVPVEVARKLNIELTKSECYGNCPAFTLNYADGIINLNAINNMKKTGIFRIVLKDDEILDFYNYVMENKVLNDLKEESHEQMATDLPYSKMSINIDEKFKVINYRYSAPKSISKIDKLFMKIINQTDRYEVREE